MDVSIIDAAEALYPKVSLKQVINEAIANSLDAGASNIIVKISGKQIKNNQNKKVINDFCLEISDNGMGFNQKSRKKFCSLFKKIDNLHKGVGRMSFKRMFKDIHVCSCTKENELVEFDFNNHLVLTDIEKNIKERKNHPLGASIKMATPNQPISLKMIDIKQIKKDIFDEFFTYLFQLKQNKRLVKILVVEKICLDESDANIGFSTKTVRARIFNRDLIDLKKCEINADGSVYNSFYSFVKKDIDLFNENFIGISIDNRTFKINDFVRAQFLQYVVIFIVFDEKLDVQTDNCRTIIQISEKDKKIIVNAIKNKIHQLALTEVSGFSDHLDHEINNIIKTKPFLTPFIDKNFIGLLRPKDIIDEAYKQQLSARKDFFNTPCNNEQEFLRQYKFSSVILTEYVMSRLKVLNDIKQFSNNNAEKEIHNLIMQKGTTCEQIKGFNLNLPNLWVLDERFMTYSYVYSDKEIKDFINAVDNEVKDRVYDDNGRPDLAIAFTMDPDDPNVQKVDVVIVELKKRGAGAKAVTDLVDELIRRLNLLSSRCKKLNRAWYFGIADIPSEIVRNLKSKRFTPLFSKGKCFYSSIPVYDDDGEEPLCYCDTYLLDYDAVINDAEARMSTFKNILISAFKEASGFHFNDDI